MKTGAKASKRRTSSSKKGKSSGLIMPVDLRTAALQDVQNVARLIKLSTDTWPGNCFGVATELVKAGLAWRCQYGCYTGQIHADSLFSGRPFSRHGWALLDEKSKTIVDPTRWVFEAVPPYIAVIEFTDPRFGDYSLGAASLRHGNAALPTAPEFDPEDRPRSLSDCKFPPGVAEAVEALFGGDRGSFRQFHWLAHRTPDELGIFAKPIYAGLITAGMGAWIPVDYKLHCKLGGNSDVTFDPRRSLSGNRRRT